MTYQEKKPSFKGNRVKRISQSEVKDEKRGVRKEDGHEEET